MQRTDGSLWRATRLALLAIMAYSQVGAAEFGSFSLNGLARYETFGYPDPDARGGRWENFFELRPRGGGRLGQGLTCQFEARVVADDAELTAGAYSARNAEYRRPYLSLLTALLDYRPMPGLRLSAGKQLVNWSGFDEVQPANLLTPHDGSDVFRRVEAGVYALSARYQRAATFVELVVVPFAFLPSRLPQGRWAIIASDARRRNDMPPVRFDETQAGLRVGTKAGELDIAVLGYVGRDFDAMIVPELTYVGGDEMFIVEFIDRYPQVRAGGMTASYLAGEETLLRAEWVYYTSPDSHRDDFLQSAVGVERALGDWHFVLNYMRDDQTIEAAKLVTSKGARRFFRSFISGELRYDPGERLQGKLRGGYDATGEFFVVQPEATLPIGRGFNISVVADIIGARRYSYFDTIRREDRIGARLDYFF